jgi:hypothetical protein
MIRTSLAVRIVRTPGNARAFDASNFAIRARASVLRRILPNSMPGRAKSAA